MEKGQIPLLLTGTAVGVISLIGYIPDIFIGPVTGYLIENSPCISGYQHVFWMLALFPFTGGATWVYHLFYGKEKQC